MNPIEKFKQLSKEELRAILAKQTEERLHKPRPEVKDLTNAEILAMEEFQDFSGEKNFEPTKRQATKRREEFEKWLKARRDK